MELKINDRIRNRVVKFFNDIKIERRLDSIASTFSLSYYFDPNNQDHKDLSCVGHYHICTIEHEGNLLFTGYIVSIKFKSNAKRQLVAISGYSLPGFLEDCEVPVKAYPLQSDGLCLREIAQKFIQPFGLKMIISSEASAAMEEKFEQTDAKETQTVKSYLTQLASQKNIIITHDEFGRLIFTKASPSKKVIFNFESGTHGIIDWEFSFNGQAMHSEITVFSQADKDPGAQSDQAIVTNPYVPFVYRPRVATQNAGTADDTKQAARNLLSAELKAMQWNIEMNSIVFNEILFKPGDRITAINPEVYIYKKTKLIIEATSTSKNSSSESVILHCVIPEVYTGTTPEYIFKGINLH